MASNRKNIATVETVAPVKPAKPEPKTRVGKFAGKPQAAPKAEPKGKHFKPEVAPKPAPKAVDKPNLESMIDSKAFTTLDSSVAAHGEAWARELESVERDAGSHGFKPRTQFMSKLGVTWTHLANWLPQGIEVPTAEVNLSEKAFRRLHDAMIPDNGPTARIEFNRLLQLACNASNNAAVEDARRTVGKVPVRKGTPAEMAAAKSQLELASKTHKKGKNGNARNIPAEMLAAIDKPQALAALGREVANRNKDYTRFQDRLLLPLLADTMESTCRELGKDDKLGSNYTTWLQAARNAHKLYVLGCSAKPATEDSDGRKAREGVVGDAEGLESFVLAVLEEAIADTFAKADAPPKLISDEAKRYDAAQAAYKAVRRMHTVGVISTDHARQMDSLILKATVSELYLGGIASELRPLKPAKR